MSRPALPSGDDLPSQGPLVLVLNLEQVLGFLDVFLRPPLQGTGHHEKGLPMDMVKPSSSMKALLVGYYLG